MKELFDSAKKFLFENKSDCYSDYLKLRQFLYGLIIDFKYKIKEQDVPEYEIANINVILKDFDRYLVDIIQHAPDNESDLENYLVDKFKHLYGVERFDIDYQIKK
jgi:hypothetical protein